MTANEIARTLIQAGIPITKIYDEDCLVDPGVDLWVTKRREYMIQISPKLGDLTFAKRSIKTGKIYEIAIAPDIFALIPAIRKEMR